MARIEVQGNAGNDAEVKFYQGQNGQFGVANFSLGYTPTEKKDGEYVKGETIWFRVSALGKLSDQAGQIKKGDKVLVIGAFKQSSYTAKDGTQKTGLEIKAEKLAIVPKAQEDWSTWGA